MGFTHTQLHVVCRRLGQKPLTTGVKEVDESVPGGGLACPTVLELVGLSGTGKTEFLLKFCAANLLPQNFDGVFIGGMFFCRVLPSVLNNAC